MRSSEIPAPISLTSPGLPATRRSIRTSTLAAARRSLSLRSHRSNVADFTTSTMCQL